MTVADLLCPVLDHLPGRAKAAVWWPVVEWRYGAGTVTQRARAAGSAAVAAIFGTHRSLLFFPGVPSHLGAVLFKVMCLERLHPTTALSAECGRVWQWQDATKVAATDKLPATAVNCRLLDISKSYVEQVFREVFGRETFVDPTTHDGPLVEKSEENARHDGRILQGPVSAHPGKVYQRVIDNVRDGEAEDIRLPVVGGEIPLVYVKRRPLASRFSNANCAVVIVETCDWLSDDEIRQVLEFSERIGLDCGEIDALRDGPDGELYLIDVNTTPFGPPNGLTSRDTRRALALLRPSYKRLIAEH